MLTQDQYRLRDSVFVYIWYSQYGVYEANFFRRQLRMIRRLIRRDKKFLLRDFITVYSEAVKKGSQ